RLARFEFVFDAVQPGGQERGQGQVRIAASRDGAVFAVAGAGDSDHLRAVVVTVAGERRSPGEARSAGHQTRSDLQPLVAVDRRAGDRAQGSRVLDDSAEEVVRRLRQAESASIRLVEEEILAR